MEFLRPEMGTVGIFVDVTREHARSTAAAVARSIRAAGFRVALGEEQRGLELADDGTALEEAVLLVTVGGDGTLLRAAQIAAPHRIPLFGINTGRLGFLTESDGKPENLWRLTEILRDGFHVDERVAVGVLVDRRSEVGADGRFQQRRRARTPIIGKACGCHGSSGWLHSQFRLPWNLSTSPRGELTENNPC